MKAIEKYIDALQKCDNKGLSELFTVEGSLADYCPNSSGHHEYHVYGREAIDMFFKNKFSFRQYLISNAEVVNLSPLSAVITLWQLQLSGVLMKTV